jgi:hypothetical protein
VIVLRRFAVAAIALLALAGIAHAQALSEPVAVLQGLDKVTARVSRLDAPIGQAVHFGRLTITVRACSKAPPEDPPNTAAFLEIDEARPGVAAARVFSGWMFASSPAISAMEDPIYDVNVLDCKSAATASPASGSPGK